MSPQEPRMGLSFWDHFFYPRSGKLNGIIVTTEKRVKSIECFDVIDDSLTGSDGHYTVTVQSESLLSEWFDSYQKLYEWNQIHDKRYENKDEWHVCTRELYDAVIGFPIKKQ